MKLERISTEDLSKVLKALKAEGCEVTYEYTGFDAWIDYGEVHLVVDGTPVRFTWDNWLEGCIESRPETVQLLLCRFNLQGSAS